MSSSRNEDDEIKIIDNAFFKELYLSLFPKRTLKSYKTKFDLLKVYVNLIKNICGDIPLIKSSQIKVKGKKQYKYCIDKEILKI